MPHGQPHTPPGLLQQNPLDDPNYDYSTILPFRMRNTLDVDELDIDVMPELAVPGLLRDVGNSAVRMGQMARGQRPPGLILGDVLDFSPAGLLNRIPAGALGINVFQGSPHRYGPEGAAESLQHIGKGEGAQAYGWGRYDAGKEAVAVDYRNALTPPPGVKVGGRTMTPFEFENNLRLKSLKKYPDMPVQEVERHSGNAARMIFDRAEKIKNIDGNDNVLMRAFLDSQSKKDDGLSKILRVARDEMPTAKWVVEKGNLYKHDLPDDAVARYLDYDAPLSKQPQSVQKALKKLGFEVDPAEIRKYDKALLDALDGDAITPLPKRPKDPTGEEIHTELVNKFRFGGYGDGKEQAAKELGRAGVPGLKYLDLGSRISWARTATNDNKMMVYDFNDPKNYKIFDTPQEADRFIAETGSRNYVTWDEEVLKRMKLLQRNDQTFKAVPGVPVMGLIEQPGGLDIMGQYTGGVI